MDQKTRPPDGFAAAVRAGFQSIAQDTSPGRLALNRVAWFSTHSMRIEVVIVELLDDRNPNRTDMCSTAWSGVAVYQEVQREFSQGDRVQFTAPSRDLHVANRELGTIERVSQSGNLEIRMDSGREVRFKIREHPHLDHGYAVTSHSGF